MGYRDTAVVICYATLKMDEKKVKENEKKRSDWGALKIQKLNVVFLLSLFSIPDTNVRVLSIIFFWKLILLFAFGSQLKPRGI